MITIFTPTYNRAYRLPTLYESLKRQTSKNFEWIVVDDGSTDNTAQLFVKWKQEAYIPIRYFRQENGGKHRGINRGVKEAKGDLFFIVDSDDELNEKTVERLILHRKEIVDREDYAGICVMKCYKDGTRVGGNSDFTKYECTLFDFRYKYKIYGDLAEVYRTDILRKFPFPDVSNERFCPEALVWHQIAEHYKLIFYNENLYICEYLPDGLSAGILRARVNSPKYAMMTYEVVWNNRIPFKIRVKGAISYWRFYFHASPEKRYKANVPCLFKPLGWLAYKRDLHTLNQNQKHHD